MFIDLNSFIIGFVAASVFWFLVSKARPLWDELKRDLKEQREAAQSRKTSSVEENHRRITLRRAQGMHLAAPLFALDEILQEPRLLIPPAAIDPANPRPREDVFSQTLPYMPAWTELAAAYNAPAFTLPQALSGNANLVIVAQPGAGKTVALAHLASLCANRSEALGEMQDFVPFLFHVAELNLPALEKNPLTPLLEAASPYAPLLDTNRLPAFFESVFKNGNALLILDGYDELAPQAQQTVSAYIKTVLKAYPQTRIVTSGAPEHLDGLIALGFAPLALMTWSAQKNQQFIEHWGKLWSETIAMETSGDQARQDIDPLLLNAWLKNNAANLSPLELTLKVWGAYAGDLLGAHVLEAIATHIRRLTPANMPLAALETLAMQVMLSAQAIFDPSHAREWMKSFETPKEKIEGEAESEPSEPAEATKSKKDKKKKAANAAAPSRGVLGKMADSGLLISHPNNRMRFAHAVLASYLAGHALSNYNADELLVKQPEWSGKYLTIRYLSVYTDVSNIIQMTLNAAQLPQRRPLLAAARCLRDAPKNAAWRGKVFTELAATLQAEGLPLGLRGQAAAALVFSGDSGASALLRRLADAPSMEMSQLAILGCGAARDVKAVEALTRAIDAPNMAVRRAACMALVAIGTKEALDTVAHTLLNGDEEIRRAAAEALANDPHEGYAMLQEAVSMNDILLRRAAVFGLSRIDEEWAIRILEKVQVEDEQGVVRNAAAEVLETKTGASAYAPRKLKAPSESPWLVEFAAKQGTGIAPGAPATDVLLQALRGDDSNLKLGALPYLKFNANENVIAEFYNVMYSEDTDAREAAFNILWELEAAGVALPAPAKYGYN
ncbi:MAG: hypothetical protein Fur002_00560 [Anaerolineales bacterium]